MQPTHSHADCAPAEENVRPLKSPDTALRVSIQALVDSPVSPRASRPVDSLASSSSVPQKNLFQNTLPMSDAAQSSVAPIVHLAGQCNLPSRPHPVKQLQGAVSKGRRNKKHICEFPGCGREFSRKSNLEAHSRKHMTGAQATPYGCQHCSRRFKWRSSLKSHEAGCMHQSLPAAIQRQKELEQRRHEMHRQYKEEQERLKLQKRNPQQPCGRLSRTAVKFSSRAQEVVESSWASVLGAHTAAVSASPVSAVMCVDFATGKATQDTPQQDTSMHSPKYSGARGAQSVAGNLEVIPRAPLFQSVPLSTQDGMLTSLRLPPLGLSGKSVP